MSLRKQIEQLKPGESFITDKSRAAVFVAAKRANAPVTTRATRDGLIKVVSLLIPSGAVPLWSDGEQDVIVVPPTPLEIVRALPAFERLALFENFELCCGMNRGECVCPPEPVNIVTPKLDRKLSLDELRELVANPQLNSTARFLEAVKDATNSEPVETWRFTSDKPQFDDNGNVYRQQYCGKKRRTVQVDAEDFERIL